MLRIGFVGWRGMVGSVLMGRMREAEDFKGFEPIFFSTSNAGGEAPDTGLDAPALKDAHDVDSLASLDVVVTCQGGGYTQKVYPELMKTGWKGYWIDSASTLRLEDDSIIVLDPVNRSVIDDGLNNGIKTFVGGNCTVSLMLMALSGLFAGHHIEWISAMTYQAASGGGAKNMKELIAQMGVLGMVAKDLVNDPESSAIVVDEMTTAAMRDTAFPTENFPGAPGGKPASVDRRPHGIGTDPGRMEGLRGDQQNPPIRSTHPHRRPLRSRRRHALPQPGADHQTEQRHGNG